MGHDTGVAQRIAELIEPSVTAMGFEIVRVRLQGGERRPTLQVMAERTDGTMTIEDCTELSRALSALLDVEDPVAGEYSLEVSSPGIDRPLTRMKDFERFKGFDADVHLNEPVDGRKRFKGRLEGTADGEILLETAQFGTLGFRQEMIADAKLILTEALIRESLKRRKTEGTAPDEGGDLDAVSGETDED